MPEFNYATGHPYSNEEAEAMKERKRRAAAGPLGKARKEIEGWMDPIQSGIQSVLQRIPFESFPGKKFDPPPVNVDPPPANVYEQQPMASGQQPRATGQQPLAVGQLPGFNSAAVTPSAAGVERGRMVPPPPPASTTPPVGDREYAGGLVPPPTPANQRAIDQYGEAGAAGRANANRAEFDPSTREPIPKIPKALRILSAVTPGPVGDAIGTAYRGGYRRQQAERGKTQAELKQRQEMLNAAAGMTGQGDKAETDRIRALAGSASQERYRGEVLIPGQEQAKEEAYTRRVQAGILPATPGQPAREGYVRDKTPAGKEVDIPTLETRYGTSKIQTVEINEALIAIHPQLSNMLGWRVPVSELSNLTKLGVATTQVAGRKDVAELRATVTRERNAIAKITADARVLVLKSVTQDDLISNTAKLEKMYEDANKRLIKVMGETSDRTFGKDSPGWAEWQAERQAAQKDVEALRGIITKNRTHLQAAMQDAMGGGIVAPDVGGIDPRTAREKALNPDWLDDNPPPPTPKLR